MSQRQGHCKPRNKFRRACHSVTPASRRLFSAADSRLTPEREPAGNTNAQIKKGAPEGPPLLLYPRFRFRRGETGPPRDKRQPFACFPRGRPPAAFFNRKNHALAGNDLGRINQFLGNYKSGNLHFLKSSPPLFYSLWKVIAKSRRA